MHRCPIVVYKSDCIESVLRSEGVLSYVQQVHYRCRIHYERVCTTSHECSQRQAADAVAKLRGIVERRLGQIVGVSGETEWIGGGGLLRCDGVEVIARRCLKAIRVQHVAHARSRTCRVSPVARGCRSSVGRRQLVGRMVVVGGRVRGHPGWLSGRGSIVVHGVAVRSGRVVADAGTVEHVEHLPKQTEWSNQSIGLVLTASFVQAVLGRLSCTSPST